MVFDCRYLGHLFMAAQLILITFTVDCGVPDKTQLS